MKIATCLGILVSLFCTVRADWDAMGTGEFIPDMACAPYQCCGLPEFANTAWDSLCASLLNNGCSKDISTAYNGGGFSMYGDNSALGDATGCHLTRPAGHLTCTNWFREAVRRFYTRGLQQQCGVAYPILRYTTGPITVARENGRIAIVGKCIQASSAARVDLSNGNTTALAGRASQPVCRG